MILTKRTHCFNTARRSMLKSAKLQSLVARCCKIRKLLSLQTFALRKGLPLFRQFRLICGMLVYVYTNFENFARLYFSYFTTFRSRTLQINFTPFKMPAFLAMQADFVLASLCQNLARMEISHYFHGYVCVCFS